MLVTDHPRPLSDEPARDAAVGIVAAELRMLSAAVEQAGAAVITSARAGAGDAATIANALAGYGDQLRKLADRLEPTIDLTDRGE